MGPKLAAMALLLATWATEAAETVSYRVQGDAIPEPLTDVPGNAARGREVVMGRDGNCLLCHAIPDPGIRFMGNVAPPFAGVATRLSAGQIRLRIVDPTLIKPDVVMPAYYRTRGLDRVAEAFRDKPVLTAQQVEDVVAYLSTLR